MLIDDLMPRFDAIRTEHLLVDMPIDVAWNATLDANFVETATSSRLVRALFAVRTAGEKAIQTVTRKTPEPQPEPVSMRLRDMGYEGDWILLGEDPPNEIVFGVIGHFWSGETVWQRVDPRRFREFDQPGFARIVSNFSLREYGSGKTLIANLALVRELLLREALSNLIDNALNHGAADMPVRVLLDDAGALHVINRGPVVADAQLRQLTDRFTRGQTKAGGSGLGLAIADTILRQAGGRLSLHSPAAGSARQP